MILDQIIAQKKKEVLALKQSARLTDLIKLSETVKTGRFSFVNAISRPDSEGLRLIAEVKKRSPSKGILRKDFDPLEIARIYQKAGAHAISVLTDEMFFEGSLNYLKQVASEISLPLLRKDFIIDEYQIYEAKINGARGVLLIVAALEIKSLKMLIQKCMEISLDPLVEVHDQKELEVALECGAQIIGINNRDLKTFHVNLNTCEELIPFIPEDRIIVVESGISGHEDILRIARTRADAVLIGEAFMRSEHIVEKISELMGWGR